MSVSIVIATYGEPAWSELAWSRAYPSAFTQVDQSNPIRVALDGSETEVIVYHGSSLAQARNVGADRAHLDWLCFLDADDELCSGYIDAMPTRKYTLPSDSICDDYTRHPRWRTEKVLLAPALANLTTSARIPNAGRWPDANECCIGTLIPRALFMRLGGFRDLPALEDYDLWLRAVKAGARIVHVPEAVYCAHVTPGSRNSDQTVYAQLREEHAEVWER